MYTYVYIYIYIHIYVSVELLELGADKHITQIV